MSVYAVNWWRFGNVTFFLILRCLEPLPSGLSAGTKVRSVDKGVQLLRIFSVAVIISIRKLCKSKWSSDRNPVVSASKSCLRDTTASVRQQSRQNLSALGTPCLGNVTHKNITRSPDISHVIRSFWRCFINILLKFYCYYVVLEKKFKLRILISAIWMR